ncbi:hypothetical protein [Corynebacterium kalidii]|uniref:Uncharacterized protein n=1 Tax=Corynebacterium kalidii TaxID=2931982 RepID=A0A9X1WG24_9CORY|nr:hypothetical protein [Corynebacterium kalidii]MCJ7858369.1 hypothetical protein [Corynebacterium kalidii]
MISTPIEIDGRYRAPDFDRDGATSYEYTPRTFHQSASARFKGPLAQTVGSSRVDQGIPSKGAVSRGVGAVVADGNHAAQPDDVRCHRYMFDADTYKVSPAGTDIRDDGQPSHPIAKYRIRGGGNDDSCRAADPSVSLVCAEFLQYRGMVTHRFHADTGASETGELAHDFLVLHVIAENCDGPTLEKVSQTLHRSRNVVEICDWDRNNRHTAENVHASCRSTKRGNPGIRLLPFFVDQAVHALNEGLPLPPGTDGHQRKFSATVHKGGWLDGTYPNPGVAVPETVPLTGTVDGNGSIPVWRGMGGNQPLRTVCAVPGHTDYPQPQLFGDVDVEEESAWCELDMWAWELGSGADDYAEGIPRYSAEVKDSPDHSRYEYWTMLPTANGTAVVRNAPASPQDCRPWMLSSTRFIDLAILIHRSTSMLSNISERLRAIRFSTASTTRGSSPCSTPDDEAQSLTADLNTFQLIQSDFVRFRDRLWFDAVPDREFETDFMTALREATGAARRYADVKDELDLRQAVYTTQFNSRQIELDREIRNRAEQDAHQRADVKEREEAQRRFDEAAAREEREAAEAHRRESESARNLALGFLAIIFAVPGLVQLLPTTDSMIPFWATAVFIVAFIAASLVYLRARQRRDS